MRYSSLRRETNIKLKLLKNKGGVDTQFKKKYIVLSNEIAFKKFIITKLL